MTRKIYIGNIRILDTYNPYKDNGIILVKNSEYYYTFFRRIVRIDTGSYINDRSQALEDHEFLTKTGQTPEKILYMEENLRSYEISNKEFKEKIKIMKENQKQKNRK